MHKRIGIDALTPGMMIVQIAAQNGPVKIRKSGLVSSEAMVQGLREMGVTELIIDPAQTVELEDSTPVARQSTPTRTLLGQRHEKPVDHQLSEQFNRSLFMPSVQTLPGPWRYYGKRTLQAALVLIGGVALGWIAATFAQWRDLVAPAPTPAMVSLPAQQVSADAPKSSLMSDNVSADVQAAAMAESVAPKNRVVSIANGQVEVSGEEPPPPAPLPATEDISPELVQKFREAVNALEQEKAREQPLRERPAVAQSSQVVRVDQLPAWVLSALPRLSFSAHMYASEPADRWVRVNGMALGEGDWINDDLRLLRIEPQQVVLLFKGQEFSMAALTDW